MLKCVSLENHSQLETCGPHRWCFTEQREELMESFIHHMLRQKSPEVSYLQTQQACGRPAAVHPDVIVSQGLKRLD